MSSWITLLSAAIGGLVGSGIPAVMTYRAQRQRRTERREDRQMLDAETLADAYRLLVDIDPARRSMSVSRDPNVEDNRWADISKRLGDISRRLLILHSGHPSTEVQTLAKKLEVELSKAATYSRLLVSSVLADRNTAEQHQEAEKCHAVALKTTDELDAAVKRAGAATRRRMLRLPRLQGPSARRQGP